MRQPERKLYTELEAVRRRVLGHAYLTAAARVEQAWVEAELYVYEQALIDGLPLPDLDRVTVYGRFPGMPV